ncbi:MAG: hypothetical protein AB7K24_23450 [Gemmataceae bacterium]
MRRTGNRFLAFAVLAIFIAGQPPFVRAFHIHPEPPEGTAHKLVANEDGEQEHHHPDECPFCPAGQCSCSVSMACCAPPQPPLVISPVCLEHDIIDVAVVYVPHVPPLPTPPPRG